MIRHRFHLRETIATIIADEEQHVEAARQGHIFLPERENDLMPGE